MRKKNLKKAIASLLTICMCLNSAVVNNNFLIKNVEASETNLLENAGFETGQNNWKIYPKNDKEGSPVISFDTDIKVEGEQSIKINTTGTVGRLGINQDISVVEGETYKVSGWLKTDKIVPSETGDTGVLIRTQFQNSLKKRVGDLTKSRVYSSRYDKSNGKVNDTYDWQQVEFEVTAPETAILLKVECFFENGQGTAWFDDVRITKVEDEVPEGQVESIELDKKLVLLQPSDTENLMATLKPETATKQSISWHSENESIAEVNNGLVTAKKVGETSIVATTSQGAISAECMVFVEDDTNNVMPNGSFESWDTDLKLNEWKIWKAAGNPVFSKDTNVKIHGDSSVRVDVIGTNGRIDINKDLQVKAGESYQVSGWIKTQDIEPASSGLSGVFVRLQFQDASGVKLTNVDNVTSTVLSDRSKVAENPENKSMDWQRVALEVDIPEGAEILKVECFFESGQGTAWFDDVLVIKTKDAPEEPQQPEEQVFESENLMVNSSFEDWTSDSNLEDWKVWKAAGTPEFFKDTEVKKEGESSVRVELEGQDGRIDINQSVPVQGGSHYRLTGWIKTQDVQPADKGDTGVLVRTQYEIDDFHKKIASGPVSKKYGDRNDPIKTYDWQEVLLDLEVPLAANNLKIECFFETGQGTAWFDDFKLVEIKDHEETIAVESMTLSKENITLLIGEDEILTRNVLPVNADNRRVTWLSDDESIAVVKNGVVRGMSEGQTTITAITEDGSISDTCEVTVEVPDNNMMPNGSFEKTVSGQDNIIWKDGVAPSGYSIWLPNSKGKCLLSVDPVEKVDGTHSLKIDIPKSDNARVDVNQSIAVEGGHRYILTGYLKLKDIDSNSGVFVRSQYLNNGAKLPVGGNGPKTKSYANSTDLNKDYDWTLFTLEFKTPEEANGIKIEMFFETGNGTAWFDDLRLVDDGKYVTGLKINNHPESIEKGENTNLTCTFTPNDATDTIIWTSSDESIATVDNGIVKASATEGGLVTIKAKSKKDGIVATTKIFIGKQGNFDLNDISGEIEEDQMFTNQIEPISQIEQHYTYAVSTAPQNGVAYIKGDGELVYHPNKDFHGNDNFEIQVFDEEDGMKKAQVSLKVNPSNDPFEIVKDWFSNNKGNDIIGDIKLENIENENEDVTFRLTTDADYGSVNLSENGHFIYTAQGNYVGYDYFTVEIDDGNGYAKEEVITVFVVPSQEDLLSKFNEMNGSNVHPRLYVTKDKINEIKALMDSDEFVMNTVTAMKENVAEIIDTPPTAEKNKNAYKTQDRIEEAALLYQLTGESRYAEFVWEEMYTVSQYNNWGLTNSMLAASETTNAIAYGYDMIYDYMTEEQRETIKTAIKEKALAEYLKVTYGERGNNINFVVNGNMGIGALAILGEEQEVAPVVLEKVLKDLQIAMKYYSQDGGWPEGPLYWMYGGQYLTYFIISMNNVLEEDYGLSKVEGFANSGMFPIYLDGAQGVFNFADGRGSITSRPESMWFASFYDEPSSAWAISDNRTRKDVYKGLSLMFYEEGLLDHKPASLDKKYEEIEVASMRSVWADDNALFAAIKGWGSQLFSHSDLDTGTFVLDANGVRWALDLGTDNYGLEGYWNHDYQRYTYYRKKPEGHNTLVINPSENPVLQQDQHEKSRFTDFVSKPKGAYAILDMSDQYHKDAAKAIRGLKLFNDRSEFIVQDELNLKKPSEVYWFMHTKADITIIENGKAALLQQDGQKLYVKLLSDIDSAKFSIMDAAPLPTSPNPTPDLQTPNTGVRKLALHMEGVVDETISVWMKPLLGVESIPEVQPSIVPLNSWEIADGEIEKVTLSGIEVNGEPLDEFNEEKKVYNVFLPFGTTEVPTVTADSSYDIEITQAQSVDGTAVIRVSSQSGKEETYGVVFAVKPKMGIPENAEKYIVDPSKITATDIDGTNVPANTVDDDLTTRWSGKGEQSIRFDLEESKEINYISMAFFKALERQSIYEIAVSEDGSHYTKIGGVRKSSGLTEGMETIQIEPVMARYIKVIGYGNTSSDWNSILEVAFFGPEKEETSSGNKDDDSDSSSTETSSSVKEESVEVINNNSKGKVEVSKSNVKVTIEKIEKVKENNKGSLKNAEVKVIVKPLGAEKKKEMKRALENHKNLKEVGFPRYMNVKIEKDGKDLKLDYKETKVKGAMKYNESSLKGLDDLRKLSVFRFDEKTQTWVYQVSKVNSKDQVVEFKMDGPGEYMIMENNKTFADVKNHWAKSSIELLASKNIIGEENQENYKPENKMSRAEFINNILKVMDIDVPQTFEKTFEDVDTTASYYNNINAAYNLGVINGDGSGKFDPNSEISREEMTVMLIRVMEKLNNESLVDESQTQNTSKTFKDMKDVSSWAKEALEKAVSMGLINGMEDGSFAPSKNVSRAEGAQILVNLIDQLDIY